MENISGGTILQLATVLSLLTPLVLAGFRWLAKRKNQPISDAQVVQGMTLTLAEGQDRRITQLVAELGRIEEENRGLEKEKSLRQRDNDLMHDTLDLYREIFRVNNIPVPRSPTENRTFPREDQ